MPQAFRAPFEPLPKPSPRHHGAAVRTRPHQTDAASAAAATGASEAQELLASLSDPAAGLLAYRTRVTDGFAALDRFAGAHAEAKHHTLCGRKGARGRMPSGRMKEGGGGEGGGGGAIRKAGGEHVPTKSCGEAHGGAGGGARILARLSPRPVGAEQQEERGRRGSRRREGK